MKKRKFQDWEFEQIHNEFGYTRHYEGFALLETWLKADDPINEAEKTELATLAKELFYNAEAWNEDELKFMFISPLVRLVNFRHSDYKIFTQRKFSAVIEEWQVAGIVDFVIAKGLQNPVHPFFFLHEHKQERKRDNDPLGQLLIGMLVAQQQNEDKIPLYGCYVLGRHYFFVVLEGREYSVSNALNASSAEDIMTIFRMFRFVKRHIEEQLRNGH
jgi:hypothetical protein